VSTAKSASVSTAKSASVSAAKSTGGGQGDHEGQDHDGEENSSLMEAENALSLFSRNSFPLVCRETNFSCMNVGLKLFHVYSFSSFESGLSIDLQSASAELVRHTMLVMGALRDD